MTQHSSRMGFVAAALLAAAPLAHAAPPRTPAQGTAVVAKVERKPEGKAKSKAKAKGPTWQLVVGPCKEDCALAVGVPGKGTFTLEARAPKGAITSVGPHAWRIGDRPAKSTVVGLEPVYLGDKLEGVIASATATTGEEVVRYQAVLHVKGAAKVALGLRARDGAAGAAYSSISPLDVNHDGVHELSVVRVGFGGDTAAERFDLSLYGYRREANNIVKNPAWRPTLYAAVAGYFNLVKEGRDFLAEKKCLEGFFVLDDKSFPSLLEGQIVVAALEPTRARALARIERAKECDPEMLAQVAVALPGLNVEEDEDAVVPAKKVAAPVEKVEPAPVPVEATPPPPADAIEQKPVEKIEEAPVEKVEPPPETPPTPAPASGW